VALCFTDAKTDPEDVKESDCSPYELSEADLENKLIL